MTEIITQDGEIIDPRKTQDEDWRQGENLPAPAMSTVVGIARAELDAQIAIARKYARPPLKAVSRKIMEHATVDEETAAENCYALRRKKSRGGDDDIQSEDDIRGPSIRLAETVYQAWGNARIATRVSEVNYTDMYLVAQAIFVDLETNAVTVSEERRNIRTKRGTVYSADMINITGRAACAIARRNAILAGVPRAAWRPAYAACRKVIEGNQMTVGENRKRLYASFSELGVTPEMIHDYLEIGPDEELTTVHIADLRATFASIKNGEVSVSAAFPPKRHDGAVKDALNDAAAKDSAPKKAKQAPPQAAAEGKGADAPSEHPSSPTSATTEASQPAPDGHPEEHGPSGGGAPQSDPAPSQAKEAAPEAAESVTFDEAGYTAHIIQMCATATSATALKDAYNDKQERAHRRMPWVTPEMIANWKATVSKRLAEMSEASGDPA